MKLLEDYKGVAIIYLVIAIVSIFWISTTTGVDRTKQVKNNTNQVVINYNK